MRDHGKPLTRFSSIIALPAIAGACAPSAHPSAFDRLIVQAARETGGALRRVGEAKPILALPPNRQRRRVAAVSPWFETAASQPPHHEVVYLQDNVLILRDGATARMRRICVTQKSEPSARGSPSELVSLFVGEDS